MAARVPSAHSSRGGSERSVCARGSCSCGRGQPEEAREGGPGASCCTEGAGDASGLCPRSRAERCTHRARRQRRQLRCKGDAGVGVLRGWEGQRLTSELSLHQFASPSLRAVAVIWGGGDPEAAAEPVQLPDKVPRPRSSCTAVGAAPPARVGAQPPSPGSIGGGGWQVPGPAAAGCQEGAGSRQQPRLPMLWVLQPPRARRGVYHHHLGFLPYLFSSN